MHNSYVIIILVLFLLFEKLKDLNIFVRYFAQPGIDNYLRITIGTDEQMDKLISALSEIVG